MLRWYYPNLSRESLQSLPKSQWSLFWDPMELQEIQEQPKQSFLKSKFGNISSHDKTIVIKTVWHWCKDKHE